MKHKASTLGGVFLILFTILAVYLFGLHQGQMGQGLPIVPDAMAAQTKAPASPVKSLTERKWCQT